MEERCHDDPSCGRVHRCGDEAQLGALEPGNAGGRAPIRYGFSVVCVVIALGVALAFPYYTVRHVELPLFVLAIVVTTWYAGVGPSALAVVLSASCYNYFFSEPLYSFEISNEDLPSFVLFTLSASSVAWFVAVRRRIESDLRHARDHGRLRWKSASAEKMKFADSTMTSPSGLGISKRATMN